MARGGDVSSSETGWPCEPAAFASTQPPLPRFEPPEPPDRGIDNLSAVILLRDVGDKRENPRFAAVLPNLFRDSFDLGALARRSRDHMDSSLRKS